MSRGTANIDPVVDAIRRSGLSIYDPLVPPSQRPLDPH